MIRAKLPALGTGGPAGWEGRSTVSSGKRDDPFADLYGEFRDRLRGDRWQPDVDVFETEKAVVVRVELAGVRRDDLRVGVDGEALRISGE